MSYISSHGLMRNVLIWAALSTSVIMFLFSIIFQHTFLVFKTKDHEKAYSALKRKSPSVFPPSGFLPLKAKNDNRIIHFGVVMNWYQPDGDDTFAIPLTTSLRGLKAQTYTHWTLIVVFNQECGDEHVPSFWRAIDDAGIDRKRVVLSGVDTYSKHAFLNKKHGSVEQIFGQDWRNDPHWYHYEYPGTFARNLAYDIAESLPQVTHIANIDLDDEWFASHLADHAKHFGRFPEAGFLYSLCVMVGEGKSPRPMFWGPVPVQLPSKTYSAYKESRMKMDAFVPSPCHVCPSATSWDLSKINFRLRLPHQIQANPVVISPCCSLDVCPSMLVMDSDLYQRLRSLHNDTQGTPKSFPNRKYSLHSLHIPSFSVRYSREERRRYILARNKPPVRGAVVAYALYREVDKFEIFVVTLRKHFKGDVVFIVEENVPEDVVSFLTEWNVTTIGIKKPKPDKECKWPANCRFKFYKQACKPPNTHCLFTDMRDVFFQSDPFEFLDSQKPDVVFIEEAPLFKHQSVNADWIKWCYGEKEKQKLMNKRVVNSGAYFATVGASEIINDAMTKEVKKRAPRCNPAILDQGILNWLLYRGSLLKDLKSSGFKVEFSSLGNPPAMTIGCGKSGYFEERPYGPVYLEGTKVEAAIVHQYDRHKNLVKFARDLVKKFSQ